MIDSAFCAGAAMITFGAILGKVSPTQLTYLLVLEVSHVRSQTYVYVRHDDPQGLHRADMVNACSNAAGGIVAMRHTIWISGLIQAIQILFVCDTVATIILFSVVYMRSDPVWPLPWCHLSGSAYQSAMYKT